MARRVHIERTQFMLLGDEIDLLGLYFTRGMCFDDERFRVFDSVSISGFSSDVDRYIYGKYALGQATAKPNPPCQRVSPNCCMIRNGSDRQARCSRYRRLGKEVRSAFPSSSGDGQALVRQFQSYAVVQKHVERCPAWVAMAWDKASPRMVDLAILIGFLVRGSRT
jgi:hypothetical protein